MRRWLFVFAIVTSSILAQGGEPLPASLPQLAAILPTLIHENKFQPGPFSDAVDSALRKDPLSAISAAAILANDLKDSDPQVRLWTLSTLHAIAITPQGPNALKAADAQIAQIIMRGDDRSRLGALMVAWDLRQNAPDSFIPPIEHVLQSPSASDGSRVGAASALALARPTDPDVESVIVSVTNDSNLSTNLRSQIIDHTASRNSGAIISDNVVHLANTSTDKSIRDAAISAATKIGPNALERMRALLIAIRNDSKESLSSHRIASAALRELP